MGDRWVLGEHHLRWSGGMRPAATGGCRTPIYGSTVVGPYDSVTASTNDKQTMLMFGLGGRWVLACRGLAGTRWTFQHATRGLTCINGAGGAQRDQRGRNIATLATAG